MDLDQSLDSRRGTTPDTLYNRLDIPGPNYIGRDVIRESSTGSAGSIDYFSVKDILTTTGDLISSTGDLITSTVKPIIEKFNLTQVKILSYMSAFNSNLYFKHNTSLFCLV